LGIDSGLGIGTLTIESFLAATTAAPPATAFREGFDRQSSIINPQSILNGEIARSSMQGQVLVRSHLCV